eukprot:RCo030541
MWWKEACTPPAEGRSGQPRGLAVPGLRPSPVDRHAGRAPSGAQPPQLGLARLPRPRGTPRGGHHPAGRPAALVSALQLQPTPSHPPPRPLLCFTLESFEPVLGQLLPASVTTASAVCSASLAGLLAEPQSWDQLLRSPFVIPGRVSCVHAALQFLSEGHTLASLGLLLPAMEHSLRRVFVFCNGLPEATFDAQYLSLYVTLDDILGCCVASALVHDSVLSPGQVSIDGEARGRPNRLRQQLGEGLVGCLLDLFQHQRGPRVR